MRSRALLSRLQTPHRRFIHSSAHTRIMDISSGNISFGRTCPGVLMEDFRHNLPSSVAKIKRLQLSLSRYRVFDLCAVGCADLAIVRNFILSIENLEELSVINYEQDLSAIWPAIFQQAKSLRGLAIHSPPGIRAGGVWTAATTRGVIQGLPKLEWLELDIGLEEADGLLSPSQGSAGNEAAQGQQERTPTPTQSDSVIKELAKAQQQQLESILINVNLPDHANIFADAHTYNAYGPTSFGQHYQEPKKQLALKIFDKLTGMKFTEPKSPDDVSSSKIHLKHLEIRFPRRSYEDRGQFWTVASSIHIRRDEEGVIGMETNEAKEYLPKWPEYGGILWNLMQ
ncbi:hypothetical protein B0H63DRAFT_467683 [Podospora didyma]|uniref:Uncharacterized protein n=1 Tax=Podospora didyma TaxID=330526 RepID=A0AAE0P0S7_9PEZI|nr:hypothetical protein B0H63DRAFT_467683 [Podospora didyma]